MRDRFQEALRADLAAFAAKRVSAPVGRAATRVLAGRARDVAAARTEPGYLIESTDNFLLRDLDDGAVLAAVATGNYKDEATSVAAAVVMREIDAAFDLAGDDEARLDDGFARAHACVAEISARVTRIDDGWSFGDVAHGATRSMRGIGASCVAAVVRGSHVLLAIVGEGAAVRAGGAQLEGLIVEEILANDASYLESIGRDPGARRDFAEDVVLRVLGLSGKRGPRPRCVHAELGVGRRLVLASGGMRAALAGPRAADAARTSDVSATCAALSELARAPGKLTPPLASVVVDPERVASYRTA